MTPSQCRMRCRARAAAELYQTQRSPMLPSKTRGKIGRSGMAGYRLYFLNKAQRIAAREEFEADSDESAITIARQRYNARSDFNSGFEVWCGDRLVFPEQDEGSASQSVA
jgi:hypothetical protein